MSDGARPDDGRPGGGTLTPSSGTAVAPYRAQVPPPLPPAGDVGTAIGGPKWIGVLIVALFFGVGGTWAFFAPLSGAVIADGRVETQGKRVTVQHLRGGIVSDLKVAEGESVAEGDVLLVLDALTQETEVAARLEQLRELAAAEARLIAERDGADTVAFSHPSLADTTDPAVQRVLQTQRDLFTTRRDSLRNRKEIFGQRVAQISDRIDGLGRQLTAVSRQQTLIAEEEAGVQELFEKGIAPKTRLLALQRASADLLGQRGALQASIAEARESVAEMQLQILALDTAFGEEVNGELTAIQSQRAVLDRVLLQSETELERNAVLAPVGGTVIGLNFNSVGGVVQPSEPILDIVPAEEALIVDARVAPTDIDELHPQMTANVVFPALPNQMVDRVAGRLTRIAPDTTQDEQTGEYYYAIEVRISNAELADKLGGFELLPGMPAQVFLTTGDRTVFEYLTDPVVRMFDRGMREF